MKRTLIILIIGIICFFIGWWTNELYRFAKGMRADTGQIEYLKRTNPFFLNDSCSENLSNKQFWSPDNYTGGFYSITFRLNKNGKVFLIDSTSVLDSVTKSGNIYHWESDTTATGNWCVRNNIIFCKLHKDREFIEKTFCIPDKGNGRKTKGFSIIDLPTVITFPNQTDTIVIRGIPCVLCNH